MIVCSSFVGENHYIDICTEYVPYVFQVLAQMLELHKGDQVPSEYRNTLPLLLTPAVWQQKGSIPGLVRLLTAFLAQDSASMVSAGQIAPVLAVAQQRLIPSKVNDEWGIELLQAVVRHVKQYLSTFDHILPIIEAICAGLIFSNLSNPYSSPSFRVCRRIRLKNSHTSSPDLFSLLWP